MKITLSKIITNAFQGLALPRVILAYNCLVFAGYSVTAVFLKCTENSHNCSPDTTVDWNFIYGVLAWACFIVLFNVNRNKFWMISGAVLLD